MQLLAAADEELLLMGVGAFIFLGVTRSDYK